MEITVKPKATESTIIATKEEDDVKKMKECLVIGQAAEEEISTKEQETMKTMEEGLRQNLDETIQGPSTSDSRSLSSSSSSSSSSSTLEMLKKLENDKNSTQNAENTKKVEEKTKENNNMKNKKASSHVWDCGSSLYDSFELNSFKRQLDSAISASSARTMSMSHLPDRRLRPLNSLSAESPPLPPAPETSCSSSGNKKHSNKISRSLQRLLKSVFRPKHNQSLSSSSSSPSSPVYKAAAGQGSGDKDRYYVVYDKSGSLTTIPESTEKEVGPEINSLVRKTVSERFPASRVVGISCA